ncbi:RNA-processing protein [Ignicoccus islandicus DSM 13165]|uniref:RNA-processing protein n=1 Tax=Ignicoccus islandicus DSM 13165 TaxID=940295 RepID=A0A0U3F7I8_9CREN|nr:KH domain-containing protein [Ignicoccus islandicus]ALU12008.1 RNA-processing protein [Ignicoccus islandicus DSM 13165]
MTVGTKFYLLIPPEKASKFLKDRSEINEIERLTRTKISIEEGGRVVIEPTEETTPIEIMKARDVISALSLGFELEDALSLLSDEMVMEVVDVRDYMLDHKNEKELRRILGRIIGKKGKAKRNLEKISGTKISISEGKVAIIGDYESVEAVKEAVMSLMEGLMHGTVYHKLEMKMRSIKSRHRLEYWKE